MSLGNYSGLKSAISDFLDRPDLTSQIDDFIDLAEARHKREIRIREMSSRESISISDRYVDLPDEFLQARAIRVFIPDVTAGRRFYPDIDYITPDKMTEESVHDSQRPCFFTVHDQIEFDSSPDQTYDGELIFFKELTPLSDSQTTNGLLARAPDCYLYAALVHAAPFLLNDERIPVWEALYITARDALLQSERAAEHIGPIISRVAGPTP